MTPPRTDTAPIGVFDSGLGGLTVVRAIRAHLPNEPLVYLGDTARIPYGTRSPSTVMSYARACASHLVGHGVRFLVAACNTVSAVALPMLAAEFDVPVLGVIEPGARAAAGASQTGRVGVLATAGTVASGAYPRALQALAPGSLAFVQAAPLFVPLAEEGWVDGTVPDLIAERYLAPLIGQQVDTLLLGCTHYPLLRPAIERGAARLAGRTVAVVDSALATAHELSARVQQASPSAASDPPAAGSLRLLVTDTPGGFREVAGRFLGGDLATLPIEQVDL